MIYATPCDFYHAPSIFRHILSFIHSLRYSPLQLAIRCCRSLQTAFSQLLADPYRFESIPRSQTNRKIINNGSSNERSPRRRFGSCCASAVSPRRSTIQQRLFRFKQSFLLWLLNRQSATEQVGHHRDYNLCGNWCTPFRHHRVHPLLLWR
jgi:hypothetical protein